MPCATSQRATWFPLFRPVGLYADDTIERLAAAFDLLLGWLELVVRLHPEVKEDVVDVATTVGQLGRGIKEERGRVTASFRKLAEHMRRTVTRANKPAGQ